MQNLQLILGCNGLKKLNFSLCLPVENCIFRMKNHFNQYQELMDYFDRIRLLDFPLENFNGVNHALHHLYYNFDQVPQPFWKEPEFQILQQFIMRHKECDVFLKLALDDKL